MADPTELGTGGDPEAGPDQPSTTAGIPRWLKIGLVVLAALVVLFVVLHLAGLGGGPGPGPGGAH